MTEEVIRKLEDAFVWGCTDLEACSYANISSTALYDYQVDHPGFAERKEVLKNSIKMRAKRVISKSIDGDDLQSAHKVIDRAEGKKVAVTGADGGALITKIQYEIVSPKDSGS
jgi:hypothetical protein